MKLTKQDVEWIRMYRNGGIAAGLIAESFGVSIEEVEAIVANQTKETDK